MTFEKIKSSVIFILLALGMYAFQYTQLANKTTILSDESNLTEDDKRMMLFSEVAYYYYYYRQIVNAPSFEAGLKNIRHDKKFTYPDEINIMTKVTAWQEIIGAWLYRTLQPPFTPLEFYVRFIIAVHALIPVLLFITIRALTTSSWLGVVSAGWYYSLAEMANRLPYQPNLRENMGLPPFLLAVILTLFYIRDRDKRALIIIGIAIFFHGLFWQFSVITQTIKILCLFTLWQFRPDTRSSVRNLCLIDFLVYILLALIYWKNAFYATPMYLAPLGALVILTLIPVQKRIYQIPLFIAGSAAVFLFLKYVVGMGASSHLVEFFLDRFFGIKTFHSQLYSTVSAFLNLTSYHYTYLSKALLLPFFGLSLIITARLIYIKQYRNHELLLLLITVSFFALSMLILRFTMIAIPFMLLYNLLMLAKFRTKDIENFADYEPFNKFMYNGSICLLVFLFYLNLSHFDKVIPQQPNILALNAHHSLKDKVKPDDVIAADMVTSSSLAHLMDNPLVIHPQYEYAENRERVKEFIKAYGYTDSQYMYNYFKSLGVNYVVLTSGRCFHEAGDSGINMREAIHFDFPKQTPDTFCIRDFTGSPYFTTVDQNGMFRILRVN